MENKKRKLEDALGHISPEKVSVAAAARGRRRRLVWLSAVAAVLVVALLIHIPGQVNAQAIALSSGSQALERPRRRLIGDQSDSYYQQLQAYLDQQDAFSLTAAEALTGLEDFFLRGDQVFLEGQENRLWSPINAYMGLAALTELAQGDARQELLTLLGVEDTEALRHQTQALWELSYHDDGQEQLRLANSLWVDQRLSYDETALTNLAEHYYTSVYRGELDSRKTTKAISQWVSQQTDGFLQRDDSQSLSQETVLALVSTIWLQSKWSSEFRKGDNTQGVFHGAQGDETCTFMNRSMAQMTYYWGDSFGAVRLNLKNGCSMWLVLPDEGKTPQQVLQEGQYRSLLTDPGQWEQEKYLYVNLSVPKFDIQSSLDLRQGLQELGVRHIFDQETDNFGSTLTGDEPVWLDAVRQNTRVAIDEKGVTAGSYLEIRGAGAAEPPKDIIDFVLDRPFLFFLTSQGVPLFSGTVMGQL